jgi:hypothetical protein
MKVMIVRTYKILSFLFAAHQRFGESLTNLGRPDQRPAFPGQDKKYAGFTRDFQDKRVVDPAVDDQMTSSHKIEMILRGNTASFKQNFGPGSGNVQQAIE